MGKNDFFDMPSGANEVKTTIIVNYFKVWASIMLKKSQSDRLAYIDLYCGPGTYNEGSKSTPVQIIEAAMNIPTLCNCLRSYFNDKNVDHINSLRNTLEKIPSFENFKKNVFTNCLEVNEELTKEFEKLTLIPSFVFIDPWGYKGLTLRLIEAMRKDWGCDCVFFFNYNRINAAISNSKVNNNINAIFGESRAMQLREDVKEMRGREREATILTALNEAIGTVENFVLPFRFLDEKGTRTSHYLIFVTKHPLGYKKMKEIMAKQSSWEEDDIPSFEYTPVLPERARSKPLFGGWGEELQKKLLKEFAGQSICMDEIYEKHNVGTKYIEKSYKTALLALESKGKITAQSNKRRPAGTFAGHVVANFPKGSQ